ncbi:MAG: SAM-dependent methyltransferase, partial [Pseudobdellovibrionaceae bacterium]
MAAYNPRDYYFKKAKQENFAARSVFKLQEIDEKFRMLKTSAKILDLGCCPGSWSQYASQKIGASGVLLGIDLTETKVKINNGDLLQGDIFTYDFESWMKQKGIEKFDVVLSDMAPKTTGIRITDQARSLELCEMALATAEK